MTKLLMGILPLELEIGRYLNIKPDDRHCRICNLGLVESEFHLLFTCAVLQDIRSAFYVEHIEDFEEFIPLNDAEKVYFLCEKERAQNFAAYIESFFRKRRSILYKVIS